MSGAERPPLSSGYGTACSSEIGSLHHLQRVNSGLTSVAAASCRWGLFRDRRPDLYGTLATLDGCTNKRL